VRRRVVLLATFVIGGFVARLAGQVQPVQQLPAFEVASVKPDKTGGVGGHFGFGGEQFSATNVLLKDLIALAYQLRPDDERIISLPDWAGSERFEIVAKAPAGTVLTAPNLFLPSGKPATVALMVRGLLAERFHLQIHADKRNMSGYLLVMAHPDRTLGRNLVRCSTLSDSRSCGVRGPGIQLAGVGISMGQLANFLSMTLQQPVVDRTELEGGYNVTLDYSPRGFFGPFGPPLSGDITSDGGPSLFTALEEQLGLKLQSTKEPVDVLVIDHVERPTPD
jgi:bla regulator protein BlaR1